MDERGSSDVVGTIGWEITENPSGGTIHRGRRDIRRDDIEVVEVVPMLDRIRQARSGAPDRPSRPRGRPGQTRWSSTVG